MYVICIYLMYRKLRLWCDGVVSSDDVHMMALYFFDWMTLHVNMLFLYRKSWTELILFVLVRESSWEGFKCSPYPSVFDFDFWIIELETFFKNQVGWILFLVYYVGITKERHTVIFLQICFMGK